MPAVSARRARIRRDLLLALYPIGLIVILATISFARPRVGPAALILVFAPYFFVPALLLVPFVFRRGLVLLRISLLCAALCFPLIVPPALNGAPPDQAPPDLKVLSWNVYVGGVPTAQLTHVIETYRPDVLVLQEVDWRDLETIPLIAETFPYQLMRPDEAAPGLAILSRLPILESQVPALGGESWDMPRVMWARIAAERPVYVVNAHPIPPRTFSNDCALPSCYNRGPRDAQIRAISEYVAGLRSRGEPLLLVGDMNVNDREEAYFDLAHNMIDVHRAVGLGFGHSWRPAFLHPLPALLRIDYMFAANGIQPRNFSTDCTWRGSDHCLIYGEFAIS
ncbi:MAG: hypothetical protein HC822_11265 [Oscillochloris sp.]|nr:hypothetical protein [Oscillochloris sp.]